MQPPLPPHENTALVQVAAVLQQAIPGLPHDASLLHERAQKLLPRASFQQS